MLPVDLISCPEWDVLTGYFVGVLMGLVVVTFLERIRRGSGGHPMSPRLPCDGVRQDTGEIDGWLEKDRGW